MAFKRATASLIVLLVTLVASVPAHAEEVCAGISEASATPLTTVRVASGLTRPLFVNSPPGDFGRLFMVEQGGVIKILRNGAVEPVPFLNITAIVRSTGNEEGLLGLAFHPSWQSNGWFFVYHTNLAGDNVVARYTISVNPDVADPASRAEVIYFNHPTNTNHNGGMIAFGPDGKLYIGTGDGGPGSGCDPNNLAQNLNSRLGKLHRIDVDALPYTIPAGNPFAGGATTDDEVWAFGLRNPYRWSFDRDTGDLYIGDVGQGIWEEVDYHPAPNAGLSRNFGWRNYEGPACPNPSCGNLGTCALSAYVAPVAFYHNDGAPECAVTGGYVYRGCRMPALHGTYFYSDYCSAFIRSFQMVGGVLMNPLVRTAELAPGGGLAINLITSYGEDAFGELYIVDQGGEVFKVVPILPNLEVSGIRAQPSFLLTRDGDWFWEDLRASSAHPITAYKVYRSTSNGSGTFDCIHQQAGTTWVGGDPQNPNADELYSYVVTAVNAAGTQSSPGTATDGTPRSLSATACP